MLFKEEVTNMDSLIDKIVELSDIDNFKVAVVCFIFDSNGKLILHRRGPGARDEVGKLQAIGGAYNKTDLDFRDALKRELIEEAGDKAVISIDEFIGCQIDGKVDKTTSQFVNWAVLAYKGTLISGEMINSEPERCIGFEKDTMENFLNENVSKTAYNFILEMLNNRK